MQKKIAGIAIVTLILTIYIGAAVAAGIPANSRGFIGDADIPTGFSPFPKETDTLDGAFENNETISVSQGAQHIQEIDTVDYENHFNNLYQINIPSDGYVSLQTPFTVPIKKNGRATAVRILWFTMRMPVGVNVTGIHVMSGPTHIYDSSVIRPGTDTTRTYKIDMGSRKVIPNGLQLNLLIDNDLATTAAVYSSGASLLLEWT